MHVLGVPPYACIALRELGVHPLVCIIPQRWDSPLALVELEGIPQALAEGNNLDPIEHPLSRSHYENNEVSYWTERKHNSICAFGTFLAACFKPSTMKSINPRLFASYFHAGRSGRDGGAEISNHQKEEFHAERRRRNGTARLAWLQVKRSIKKMMQAEFSCLLSVGLEQVRVLVTFIAGDEFLRGISSSIFHGSCPSKSQTDAYLEKDIAAQL
ncbi:hypothetical protein HYFRA_00009998 [Hymenoscyphus fraxineus]|uniref:Uncharacterized protein n=1 Tax=Hymenoscyphus fraxineus TaxID=746836 RepID=A0A9N9PNI1_9HELO|nr:hypothetical protein HYFRA_00009998 [Hymenoscyphus fraxineus]